MRLPFKIAVRFLKSNKGQTILIALGIAVGVSVQIFIGSLIQGLQKDLVDTTIGNSSQITIKSDTEDGYITNYKEKLKEIEASDDRIKNLSVVVDGPALTQGGNKNYSLLIRGFNIEDSNKIYEITDRIYEGEKPRDKYDALIGKDLKEELGVKIGDTIDIVTNSGKSKEMMITGFFDLKVASINESWMITTLDTSQDLFAIQDKITSIEMQVSDVFESDTIADKIEKNLESNLEITNWKAQNEELLSGLNGQSVSSLMIQVFVMIAVVLGIASVLAITVIQKSKQLGILKAMGIKDRTASLIFLFEGLLLGIIGAILGVALGLLLSFLFTKFAVNPDGTPVVSLYIDYTFIAISTLIAISSAIVAALIPARRSSKLNPIEVIRNG
ncbi:ABC transporter permease [Clostridium sp. D2Q-11]|uniref:ABC transporter permease n=1 Tax=Anaeromonas frigoriresistens TaxID=2683708 RepID=A0A942Z8R3_9FIRM|nr:ABC transporter permease [Anaeromonas frigoriresistens]MBS4538538.1 ABC transporter permease [Anaeromonas frigoriresistens]